MGALAQHRRGGAQRRSLLKTLRVATCVLAGDVGGTKTNLAIYSVSGHGTLAVVREASFPSRDYAGLEPLVAAFLARDSERISAAAFGIAGPVIDGAVQVTNLPWHVEAQGLGRAIGCSSVRLMNDLESTAYGALFVEAENLLTLQAGQPRAGNRAVIAAGTGLGEAILFWDGTRYHPSPTEGGHADFGPRDAREDALCVYLRGRFGRVSYERVCSGLGLQHVFEFLADGCRRAVAPEVRARMQHQDPSAVIGQLGLARSCATCVEALDIFVSIYGAQAGNLALDTMSVGGLYIGGGMVTKLLPLVTAGPFMDAFRAKDPHRELLERIPVYVLLDPKTAQLGAAYAAAGLL